VSRSARAQAAVGWLVIGILGVILALGFVAGCTFKALVP
jgi:type IV secretory pathway TrbF-like protein